METVTQQELLANKSFFLTQIQTGKLFIYPTDTIYGIGCNAQLPAAVEAVRKAKQRPTKPLSVIAPSNGRITKNFQLLEHHRHHLKKLPGPYTFILPLTNKDALARASINPSGTTVGVRIPDNWFYQLIKQAHIPFVTSSANISGQPPISSVDTLPQALTPHIDYVIDDGQLTGDPSRVIDLTSPEAQVVRS